MMKCINAISHTEYVIKKSRFLSVIFPCDNEKQVQLHLSDIRSVHVGANHIAFSYRIKTDKGIVYRFYDDGEPSGTAGKPIFNYIEGHDLINALIIVVRYFGGIKLGAGGLTRAYGHAAKKVLEVAIFDDFIEMETLKFDLDYHQFQSFEYHLEKFSGHIISKAFTANIKLVITLPVYQTDNFLALFIGYKSD